MCTPAELDALQQAKWFRASMRRQIKQRVILGSFKGGMAVTNYFSSLDGGSTVDTITDPQKIFHALPAKAMKYEYLRDVQGEVLAKWHLKRTQRDVVIKMNTGGGKTVVGLLALKSCLNEGTGPVVYISPDHYLCDQVLDEAKDLGIETTEDPRSPRYMSGRAVLVIPVHTLFNGKSKFGVADEGVKLEIGTIVIDDAHACLSIAEGQFTISLPRTHDVYGALFHLFRDDIATQSISAATEIEQGDPRGFVSIPYWAWTGKANQVVATLVQYSTDPKLEFVWPLLKASINLCHCLISSHKIEISLRCLPVDAVPSFVKAKRRIYMTATLADDSILVTDFDADPAAIATPIAPKGGSDIGERLILVPQEINTKLKDEEIRDFVAHYAQSKNVVVIVPSGERAKFWSTVASQIVNAENIHAGVSKLRSSVGNLVVMVNKYDGVDLPNDACRLLVVDGIPDARRMIDRYEQGLLETSKRNRGRQIQRIEQGMGRGIRASHDYCIVLLMGAQLLGALYGKNASEFFSAPTEKQLALSRKVARLIEDKGLAEMAKVVDSVLARDPQWVSAAKNALIDVSYPDVVVVDPISIGQRQAFDAARRGNHALAEQTLRGILDKSESKAVEGWLLQQIAEVVHPIDNVKSQSILAGAHERNLHTLRPLKGIAYPRVDTVGLDQATQASEFLQAAYANGNALVLGVNAMLDRLQFGPDTAEDFEQGLADLGLHLGFRAQRPEKLGVAHVDVLWGIGERRYLLLPCKSEATSSSISKTYGDQLSGAATWFHNAYDHTCQATPVIVHPVQIFDPLAPFPADTRVLTTAKIEALKQAVTGFALSVKGNLKNITHVRTALEAGKLLGNQFTSHHTLPAKKSTT